jgi:YVTN family beta-propeller protein
MLGARDERATEKATYWSNILSGAVVSVLVFLAGLGLGGFTRAALGQAVQSSDWSEVTGPRYLSPIDLKLSPDGQQLYVVCEDSDLLLLVDTHNWQVTGRVKVGHKPKGIALSPNGKSLYVSNEWENTISEIDAHSFQTRRTLQAGWGPVGITTDRTGEVLYVANTLGNDVSLFDLSTGKEIKRLAASTFPEYVALSRDGSQVYISNLLARPGPSDRPPASELTAIDTRKQVVSERILVPGVIQLRHIAEVPTRSGSYMLVPFMRPKNLNPLVQIEQGWYLTHGMAMIRPSSSRAGLVAKSRVGEVLLDDIDYYYADGFGAACTPDGKRTLVTAAGANVVSVIDNAKLNQLQRRMPPDKPEALADRLDSARQFVVHRIPTGREPTGIAVAPDGRFAYIANRLDDTVSVVDLAKLTVSSTINLGGPKEITAVRRGERLFYDASYCFQGQLACATCHPHEGLSDGLTWMLETPKLGRDVVENRTLLGIADTSPFKWNGKNRDLATQAGPRAAMFIFRSQGFSPREAQDVQSFIQSLRLPRNPHLGSDRELTDAQERGREIFFRTGTNNGSLIPPGNRCYFCHPPSTHYTSRVQINVGTATTYDTIKEFDIPQLESVYMRAPYLHNGEAQTLEEIWTKFNPEDKHGITSDMDKLQLNDLIEFLKTL